MKGRVCAMTIQFFKGEPSSYVFQFRNGRIVRQGLGIQFWYLPMMTSVSSVPVTTQVAPFIFRESTENFQEISIQGTVSYRITEPAEIVRRLDFEIELPRKNYRSDEPEKLVQRIVNAVQANTRNHVSALTLEAAIQKVQTISDDVLASVARDPDLVEMGIVLEGLHFSSVQPSPEMKKALEAEYRERLQQDADQAIYARRAAAVEEERKIRAREMETEVELENRKKELVDTQARNQLALAESDAKAEEMRLNPYGDMPPQALIGLALKEWAAGSGTIGNLSVTPDLLGQIVGWMSSKEKA